MKKERYYGGAIAKHSKVLIAVWRLLSLQQLPARRGL